MKSTLRLLVALLLLVPALRAEDSADVVTLRNKAEQGNSIAQYNLGLAYQRGAGTEIDLPEAFVWLTLASENGTKGPALEKTLDALTPAQLSEAKRRLDAHRAKLTSPAVAATAPSTPAPAASAPAPSAPSAGTSSLQNQLDEARQSVSRLTLKNQELEAAAVNHPSPAAPDTDKTLAETQDKLSTSLRSYTLLRDENDQLKTTLEKASAEKTDLAGQLETARSAITGLNQQLTAASAAAAQSTAYHDQLRQTQDQLASVSAENSELRGRLATTSPGTGLLSAPTRPGAAPTAINSAPLPAFEPEHPLTAAPVDPAPVSPAPAKLDSPAATTAPVMDTSVEHVHIVAAGETLSGIALRYYGNSVRWAEILEANRSKLRDEKSLRVGMKLRIPALH